MKEAFIFGKINAKAKRMGTLNRDNLTGSLAALFSNVIFGLSFLFSTYALTVAHPLVILAARFTAAFLFMNLLLLFRVIKIDFRKRI